MSGPYAYINDKAQHYSTITFSLSLNPRALYRFEAVNAHLRDQWVMPGQIIVIPDSHSTSCTVQEARLMEAARVVSRAFGPSSEGVGTFVVQNYDLLQSLLGHAGLLIDSASGSWARHLDGIIKTLEQIDREHKLYLRRGTPIARAEFLNSRQKLFQKLDVQLAGMARYGTGLRNQGSIKKMLGVSTRSYLHNGTIKGYAQRIDSLSRTAKFLKNGTYVGWGLSATASAIEVQEACATGREDQCRKAKFVEASKLGGNILGGGAASLGGAAVANSICVGVLGVASGGPGAIACVLIGTLGAGWAGSELGSAGGETLGNVIYEGVAK